MVRSHHGVADDMKTEDRFCHDCQKIRPIELFRRNHGRPTSPFCRDCSKRRARGGKTQIARPGSCHENSTGKDARIDLDKVLSPDLIPLNKTQAEIDAVIERLTTNRNF